MILYTKTACPWCDEVRDYLIKNKIEFEEREVIGNKKFFGEMIEKSGQFRAPVIDFEGKILADAGVEEVEDFLKENKMV